MTKMDNKGFLLAESLIVSTFVLAVLIFLFAQFKNIVVNYKTSYVYNSIEDVYSLGSLADYLKTYEDTANPLNTQLIDNNKEFYYVYKDSENIKCQIGGNDQLKLKDVTVDFCETLGSQMNLEYAIYTNSDLDIIKNSTTLTDNDLKNFIKKIDATPIENKGRLIAKFKNGHYATVAMNVAKQYLTPLIKAFDKNTSLMDNSGIKKSQITVIQFENVINTTNAEKSWDVSAAGNGSVMAWVTQENNNILHIGGDGGVIANENSQYLFYNFKQLKEIAFNGNYDMTNVTDVNNIFNNCNSLTSIDLEPFSVATGITNMKSMFRNCTALQALNLSHLNTHNVTSMEQMFLGCEGISVLNIDNLYTENVTDMSYMFSGCVNLQSLTFNENFNTAKVKDMQYMFSDCRRLTSLDLSKFNTEHVGEVKENGIKGSMASMFYQCEELSSVNLSSFNTQKVTVMNTMFNACKRLEIIYASDNFVTDNVLLENSDDMFNGCDKLVGGNGTTYASKNAIDYTSARNKTYAKMDKPGQEGYFTQAS